MKTTFVYGHYFLYEEILEQCNYYVNTYPQLVSMETLCMTQENRPVVALTLTNKKTGDQKPGFYIDANHHAGEVTGSMVAMHTMDTLLTNYGSDENITKILDTTMVYIIPRVSPDGSQTYLTTPFGLRSVNREYLKSDKGLKQKDVDEDGSIRMMRVKSPYGAWKKHPSDPKLMELRKPDETEGEFYNVYMEGTVDGFDGLHIDSTNPDWGLDFNRNYPFGWFPEHRQPGAGKYPLSNPENKAVVDFILAHDNIGGILTHHTSGGVILYPPGTKASYKSEFFDMKMYQNIGKMAKEEMGYPTVNIFDCFMIDQENYSSGCLDDWAYQTQGIYAYTVELWDLKSKIGKPVDWNKRLPFDVENELDTFAKVIKWCEENHVDAFKEWTPVVHPQLGDIEIGGFDQKFVYQNPPKQMLQTEVEHATNFTLRFIKTMPKLVIDFVKTTKVSDDVYEITAQVSNAGYLPTYLSREAINLNVHKNVKVTLACDGTVLNGTDTVDLGGLNGFGGVKTGIGFGGNIDTYASEPISKQVTWLVKGNPNTITVTASSPKTGTTVKTC